MRYANSITMSVFVKPEDVKEDNEINEKIVSLFHKIMPLDWEKEKISLIAAKAEGFESRQLIIYELKLTKESHTNVFLKTLNQLLTDDQRTFILSDKQSRVDDELEFFLRLDKKKLLNNEAFITDSGDCFHIKISIAAFPRKKEAALKVVEQIFTKTI